jgi:hypothetical protein
MKITKYIALFLTVWVLGACNDEPELTVLRDIVFPEAIQVSTDEVVVTESNLKNEVLTITWPAVDYGIGAPVDYAVQFTTPNDTVGAAAWSQARTVKVGTDVLTATYDANTLNKNALRLGLEANVQGVLVIRVQSYVDRYAYSDPVAIRFTPYEKVDEPEPGPEPTLPALWVPGDYQGWNPATAPFIVDRGTGIYEGYVYFPDGGTCQFKFTAQAAWEPMAYGSQEEGALVEANYEGDNITVPDAGYYMLTANLSEMTYSATKTSWSIIGDATAGGWETDTPMQYDAGANVWRVTTDMSTAGSFKFRANNAWIIDFGVDEEGTLLYADHPVLGYTAGLLNLTVPETGKYTITLDLSNPEAYSYELKLN